MRREREYQCLRSFRDSAGCLRTYPFEELQAGMQVLYQRCAAVDIGKDVIAVAVRRAGWPGRMARPDGRQTVKRTFKTFYGVVREAARWLTGHRFAATPAHVLLVLAIVAGLRAVGVARPADVVINGTPDRTLTAMSARWCT